MESLQDKSKNSSHTIGASVSGGENGVSGGGVNANILSGSKKWVTEQTSLTGGSVDIYVEDKTTLKGAVIASDIDKLKLDTGSLEYRNIKDRDRGSNFGGGGNISSGAAPKSNSQSLSVSYGFTDKRQTNFATIGEGEITVRDTSALLSAGGSADLSKLNRDTTKSQYSTLTTGLEGGFTLDTATVNLIAHPENTVLSTVSAIDTGIDNGIGTTKKIIQEVEVGVERTGNLIEYGHFTTDDKVQYCLNMDEYKARKASGEEITAFDTLLYLKSKSAAGYELDNSDISSLRLASAFVIDDVTDGIVANLKANIRVNSKEEVLASLAVLDRFDKEDVAQARAYLAGVRAEDNYWKQLAITSSLRDAELGMYEETGRIYKEQKDSELNFTVQVGITGTLAAGGGISGSAGIAVSYSDEEGLDFGTYKSYSIGGYSGVVVSGGGALTLSSNGDLNDLEGTSLSVGGSTKFIYGGGLQVDIPVNSAASNSYTVSGGVGVNGVPYILPAEGHVIVTHTEVTTVKELIYNNDSERDWISDPD